MSDAPQAEKREGPTPEHLAQREKFEGLYCDWHVARAALFDPNRPEDDRTSNARSRRADEAERALLTTPAPLPWGVWMKWEVLDWLMINEQDTGAYTDNRVMVAVAAIKADVLRFGMNNRELGVY
jgi:hypothetical protein